MPQAIAARVIEVAPRSVPILFDTVGQIEGSKEVEVRARVSGILQKRIYNEGELVLAGAPLFQIDPASFEIALAQARAQLAQESARNEQARRESGRLKVLAEQRAISQREFDDAMSALKLSDAGIQAAQARVREAELNLSYTQVTAPVTGLSGRAARSEGSLITAGSDSLLTTINQISPIWARFSLSESDLANLPNQRLGSSTEVRLTLPDGSLYEGKGRINFAATQIDPRIGTRQVRAEFDNARQRLLPGQFVRVQVTAGQRDHVFLVPQTAVLQTEKGYFVFVLGPDSKAALRPVRTGAWVGKDWSILDGLNAGDRVVVDNLQKLQPGATVKALEAATADRPASAGPAGAAGSASGSAPAGTQAAPAKASR
ncbi:MAG: efflux RND transporter periplasmic adaptor subunit [Betaproteobacteria bacterium]|nr:efflux RND transporter periplasmic adaptor subunit [Betaproteobacteria bacterium]